MSSRGKSEVGKAHSTNDLVAVSFSEGWIELCCCSMKKPKVTNLERGNPELAS